MSTTMIYKLALLSTFILTASCGSNEFVPTKDICKIEKHWKDNLFQVQINDQPINKHWYLYDDAVTITKDLGDKNLCMK